MERSSQRWVQHRGAGGRLFRGCAAALGLFVALFTYPGGPCPVTHAETRAANPAPPDTSSLEESIVALEARVRGWGGRFGVYAVDLSGGRVLAARHEHDAFNPASNAKLATAAVALRVLGAEHRFLTGLYGALGTPTLDELVLRGDGDPTLRTADLWVMAAELRASGVRRVVDIVADQSAFDEQYVPPAFEQQPNEWAAFRAPVAPVSLNRNTITFAIRAPKDGMSASVEVDPPGFTDLLGTVAVMKEDDAERLLLGVEPMGARLQARLGGSVPSSVHPLQVVKRVADPRLLAAFALKAALVRLGVEVSGELRVGRGKATEILVSHRSARLAELLLALGKDSDNFTAEMIFKAIGARASGRPGSSVDAAAKVEAELRRMNAFEDGVVVLNGSGLFDANRSTAAAVVALLRTMQRDGSVGPEFVTQLSIGGVDGTLRHRFRAWAATRSIRGKTGTLNGVATLAGYVFGQGGKAPIVFSAMINGVGRYATEAHVGLDTLVDAMARGK